MNINIVQNDENNPNTREQYLAYLKDLYAFEDNTGRTFELAADLMMLRYDVWNAMCDAEKQATKPLKLLRNLENMYKNIDVDLEWPIEKDDELQRDVRVTFEEALDRYREYPGNEVIKAFIERLEVMSKDAHSNEVSLINTNETIQEIVVKALNTNGEHHKQWFLWQIAKIVGVDVHKYLNDAYKGIAP